MMQHLNVNRPLLLSVVCAGIAAVVLFVPMPGLLAAMFTSGLGPAGADSDMQAFLADHETDLETYRQRFDGRSLFSRPPAPLVKVVQRIEPTEDIPEPPKPKPIVPMLYAGPRVIGIIGDQVWFKDDLRLRVGEEGSGVTVLASNPPWTVKLSHEGGEYDVPVFNNYQMEFSSNAVVTTPTPGVVVAGPTDGPAKADDESKGQSSDDS